MRWLEAFKACFGHRAQELALRRYVQGLLSDHRVSTTLRSTPCGRGGDGGTSPASMRCDQSANICSARSRPKLIHAGIHRVPALSRLNPMIPGGRVGVEAIEMIDLPRDSTAHLMAELAALLHDVDPRGLTLQVRRDPVPGRPRARELALVGWLDHRAPVVGRVDLGRLLRGRRRRGEGQPRPGDRLDRTRVLEPVPSSPRPGRSPWAGRAGGNAPRHRSRQSSEARSEDRSIPR